MKVRRLCRQRKNCFKMNHIIKSWIRRKNGTLYRNGHNHFVLFPDGDFDRVKALLADFEKVQENSLLMKSSRTTTAGIAGMGQNDEPIFWKRNNNKGLRFTLQYLFHPARVFNAAMAADYLEELGIATPKVLAVGECRIGCYLKCGYLLTQSSNDIHQASQIFLEISDPEPLLESFFSYCGKTVAKLHDGYIIHGDLKISNFYYFGRWTPDTAYGIWDLDSVRKFRSEPDPKLKVRELSRIISSILIQSDGNPLLPQSFFDPERLTRLLLAEYAKNVKGAFVPEVDEVKQAAEERWLSEEGLMHSEKYRNEHC